MPKLEGPALVQIRRLEVTEGLPPSRACSCVLWDARRVIGQMAEMRFGRSGPAHRGHAIVPNRSVGGADAGH